MVLHEEDSDELLSRLFRRCYGCNGQPETRSQPVKSRRQGIEVQTLAVTNLRDLTRELAATERIVYPRKLSEEFAHPPPANNSTLQNPTWDDLEEIFRELHELYERSDKVMLSLREQEYARILTESAVRTITQACLSGDHGDLDASGVRVKLLELAVRPTAQWRCLAFTLFLNAALAAIATILSVQDESSIIRAQHLEVNLFKLLREMLGKAVVVSTATLETQVISSRRYGLDWVEQAVGCLEFFVKKANGSYSSDRLRCLDEHTLIFLVAETSNRGLLDSEVQEKAMDLVVATMYACKISPVGKSVGPEWQQPTKDHTVWNCGLPLVAVEQYVSLELLLYHFYNSPIGHLQRLACMVLVDVVCEQLRRTGSREGISTAGLDQIWHTFVEWEDPSVGMRQALLSPYISSARVVKLLAPSCSLVPEKHLNAFVNQFRLLTQIDTYFGVNPSLDKVVKLAKNHTTGSISDEVLEQVSKQLLSHRAVDRFRGERWLAELLTYGQDDDVFTSFDSKAATTTGSVRKQAEAILVRPISERDVQNAPSGEELEETFCYDEGGEIGQAAQSAFWRLASPTNPPALRESFARVLVLFVRRKLQLSVSVISLQVTSYYICQCELSYIDKRWQQRDASAANSSPSDNQLEDAYTRVAWSDALASRVLNGVVALDKTLVRQIYPEFFLHVLKVLHESCETHQSFGCRQVCCGVEKSLVGDIAACTALILTDTLADNDAALASVGGLPALTPFLQACDTRVAVYGAVTLSMVGVNRRS
ncbi:unnamed protein product [Phytophthora fragariaefolia]|uniref:Unnamed protein product n=1 Tax=Phytophthora fragariaefolia TaxID=1490495 RepID=A0A9W6XSF6_9STRA|nr:unnamed protein product [Phytophthora fragariaefolia]